MALMLQIADAAVKQAGETGTAATLQLSVSEKAEVSSSFLSFTQSVPELIDDVESAVCRDKISCNVTCNCEELTSDGSSSGRRLQLSTPLSAVLSVEAVQDASGAAFKSIASNETALATSSALALSGSVLSSGTSLQQVTSTVTVVVSSSDSNGTSTAGMLALASVLGTGPNVSALVELGVPTTAITTSGVQLILASPPPPNPPPPPPGPSPPEPSPPPPKETLIGPEGGSEQAQAAEEDGTDSSLTTAMTTIVCVVVAGVLLFLGVVAFRSEWFHNRFGRMEVKSVGSPSRKSGLQV